MSDEPIEVSDARFHHSEGEDRKVEVTIEGGEANITAPVDANAEEIADLSSKLAAAVLTRAMTGAQEKIVRWAALGKVIERLAQEMANDGLDARFGLGLKNVMPPDKREDQWMDVMLRALLAKFYELAEQPWPRPE